MSIEDRLLPGRKYNVTKLKFSVALLFNAALSFLTIVSLSVFLKFSNVAESLHPVKWILAVYILFYPLSDITVPFHSTIYTDSGGRNR